MFSRLIQTSTARQVLRRTFSAPAAVSGAETPTGTVYDIFINLVIVDPSGARKNIKGIIGKTLYEACELQGVELGPASLGGNWATRRTDTWVEQTFGEGAVEGFDHVVLTGKGAEAVEDQPHPPELQALDDHWDGNELYEGSRLASRVVVNKGMDGMVVYVPDRLDDICP
eukprot:CAMPEP_0172456476 /NCGR_PEP_ID=MMETSP1065-20121228/15899_1 /TAXON_ID=265537 /ORGANISM="Amphiprora paludosa, Strain CCMP125" /LENGTH=169 /DNA_ID=CAMNT_0013209519 /DNA_START=102 /DNA_END=611 /DNA_ORIENTATION=+